MNQSSFYLRIMATIKALTDTLVVLKQPPHHNINHQQCYYNTFEYDRQNIHPVTFKSFLEGNSPFLFSVGCFPEGYVKDFLVIYKALHPGCQVRSYSQTISNVCHLQTHLIEECGRSFIQVLLGLRKSS